MKDRINILIYRNGCVAKFDSKIGCEASPDYGRRVKHYVFKDDRLPNAYIHISRFLTTRIGADGLVSEGNVLVSERVFWGKFRLVETRDICLADTWNKIAYAVQEMQSIEARKLREKTKEAMK